MAFTYSVLVVGNQTAGSDELLGALKARAERNPAEFTLLVPASGPGAREAARENLDAAVARLRDEGLTVEGEIGDSDPLTAVREAWDPRRFDEIVVSTFPTQASKWLQVDLPHRIARLTGVQVTHVVSELPKHVVTGPAPEHESHGVLSPLSVLSWGGAHPASRRDE
jgi:hypothetical protein